eukprot:GILK01006122.1.p1 GENE.GILK01006122.1~~GILK01006122.1.p1  ORF type:complete len:357 (+),score=47.72 GILK01006122.1:41-1072(+)
MALSFPPPPPFSRVPTSPPGRRASTGVLNGHDVHLTFLDSPHLAFSRPSTSPLLAFPSSRKVYGNASWRAKFWAQQRANTFESYPPFYVNQRYFPDVKQQHLSDGRLPSPPRAASASPTRKMEQIALKPRCMTPNVNAQTIPRHPVPIKPPNLKITRRKVITNAPLQGRRIHVLNDDIKENQDKDKASEGICLTVREARELRHHLKRELQETHEEEGRSPAYRNLMGHCLDTQQEGSSPNMRHKSASTTSQRDNVMAAILYKHVKNQQKIQESAASLPQHTVQQINHTVHEVSNAVVGPCRPHSVASSRAQVGSSQGTRSRTPRVIQIKKEAEEIAPWDTDTE